LLWPRFRTSNRSFSSRHARWSHASAPPSWSPPRKRRERSSKTTEELLDDFTTARLGLSGGRRALIQQAAHRGPRSEKGDDEQRDRYETTQAHGIAEDQVDQFEDNELAAGRDHP
jgi:hypothetical protein